MFKTAIFASLMSVAACCCSVTVRADDKKSPAYSSLVQTCTFKVTGMTCASCSVTLKAALKKLDGVQNVAVSVGDDSASVTFDPGKVTTKDIVAKIDNVGYKAELNQCKA